MAAGLDMQEIAAVIEADGTEATLTIDEQKQRRTSLLNLGPNGVILRFITGVFINSDPASPVQADGEAILPANNSFPLWTSLTSVRYKTAAGESAFLTVASDTE